MANELKTILDAIDEAVVEAAKSSYMKAAVLQAKGMWDKGRAILEKYPEVRDGKPGRNPSQAGGGLVQISYSFVAEETDRKRQDIKKWVALARKYPTRSEAREWIDKKAGDQTAKYIASTSDNVHFSSESDDWSTPGSVIESVMEVLGSIELDPCSDETGTVPAVERFKKADDGLSKKWHGTVYMNPPYGKAIDAWVAKLVDAYKSNEIKEAIALVPSRTDTEWMSRFAEFWICNVRGRLKFGGNDNSAPFPSCVVYLGKNPKKFWKTFSAMGDVRPPAVKTWQSRDTDNA